LNAPLHHTQIILLVLFTYHFLIDGEDLVERAVELTPNKHVVRFFLRHLNGTHTVLFRIHLLVALISGVMTAFSFYLIGIPYPITLSILIVIFDPLLAVGPGALLIPLALYYVIVHSPLTALAVLLLGFIFVILIPDYFIRPQLVSLSARIYSLVVILAFTIPSLCMTGWGDCRTYGLRNSSGSVQETAFYLRRF
jgi:predicted PurR-regulated permease PerM